MKRENKRYMNFAEKISKIRGVINKNIGELKEVSEDLHKIENDLLRECIKGETI